VGRARPGPGGGGPGVWRGPVLALLTGGEGGWNALKLSLRVLAGRRPLLWWPARICGPLWRTARLLAEWMTCVCR
jgi:hypothetical protein